MERQKNISFEEWKRIANKVKEIEDSYSDLLKLLQNNFPKTYYIQKWTSVNKSFGKLKSHLDEIYCEQYKDLPDSEFKSIFYGMNNN
jgi:hypothetical protein